MQPGETNVDKKTVSFALFTTAGLPASGLGGEGAVAPFVANELQISYDYGNNYVTATGTYAHGGDGSYKYMFSDAEVSSIIGEKNIWLRYKETGYKTMILEVPLRYDTDRIYDELGTVNATTNTINFKIGSPAVDVATDIADVKSDTSLLPTVAPMIETLHRIGVGRWKIQGTQLLIYEDDETTVLMAFNLLDDNGDASNTRIFERMPVP